MAHFDHQDWDEFVDALDRKDWATAFAILVLRPSSKHEIQLTLDALVRGFNTKSVEMTRLVEFHRQDDPSVADDGSSEDGDIVSAIINRPDIHEAFLRG